MALCQRPILFEKMILWCLFRICLGFSWLSRAFFVDRFSAKIVILTLPPTAYRILWLLRYHGRSYFGPFIAIDHLLTGTYRGHMPKFVLKSQKFNEILRFVNFEITRFFPFVDTRKLV